MIFLTVLYDTSTNTGVTKRCEAIMTLRIGDTYRLVDLGYLFIFGSKPPFLIRIMLTYLRAMTRSFAQSRQF